MSLFIIAGGYLPFYGENKYQVMEAVVHADYSFEEEPWRHVSDTAMVSRVVCLFELGSWKVAISV